MALILCTCDGKIGSQLNLDGIRTHLEKRGERVLIGDKPCREGIDPVLTDAPETGPIVIGGCLSDSCKDQFRDAVRKKGLDPFALTMVPLVGETSEERAEVLLTAAVERLRHFVGSQEKYLKPRFCRIDGNMSRRQFFRVPKIHYDLIPSIDGERCRTKSLHCHVCMKRCSSGAISVDGERGKAVIEKNACTGCGVCVRSCPGGAIQYPYFSPREITAEIDALLRWEDTGGPKKRALLFFCEDGGRMLNDFLLSGGSLPNGFLPVAVPCVGMLDAFYFVYSFIRGAVAVGVFSCSDTPCRKGADLKRLHEEIEVSSALLKEWGIAGDRLLTLNTDSRTHLEEAFHSAERSLADLQKPEIPSEGANRLGTKEHSLPMLLQKIATREVFVEGLPGIPSGMIRMAEGGCTLCGVCGEYCPGNALRIEESGAGKVLRFSPAHCIACAECVRRCPEDVLRLKRVIDTAGYRDEEGVILAQEAGLSCSECGKPFLTEAMVRRLMAGFSTIEAGKVIRMCPDCRARETFSELFG